MSRIRSRMRSRLTRPSARASGPPGQEWAPRPNAMWAWALGRSTRNSAGHSNRPGSRLAAPLSSITGVPGRDVDAADGRGAAGEAEVGLHRALDAQRLLDEVRDAVAVRPQLVLELGVLGEVLQRGGEQTGGRLLAGGEQERRRAHDRRHLGRRPVGVGRQRQVGEHVLARLAAPVLDVLGEPLVEPRQRVQVAGRPARRRRRPRRALPLRPKPSRNRWWSASGTPSRSATTSMAKGCA